MTPENAAALRAKLDREKRADLENEVAQLKLMCESYSRQLKLLMEDRDEAVKRLELYVDMDQRLGIDALTEALAKHKAALRKAVDECPYACLSGDCGAEWEMEPKPCPFCTEARKLL